ncbi:MAG: methyltransferase domain-containing protein [Candidatus Nanosalina sp.]
MTYLYLLAGENLELAEAELKGFLESQEIDGGVARDGRMARTDEEPERGQLRRLALVHEVSELLGEGGIDDVSTDYRPENSFAVRATDTTGERDTKQIEKELGAELETAGNDVELENPDEVVRVYLVEDRYYIGKLVEEIDRGLYERRKNQERPFSSPVSLDPVLARVLVNLSCVRPGEHLLDPFCGTGGILIEAGLCGAGVHGLDVKGEMVSGTEKNLEEYGVIAHDIREGEVEDAAELFDRKFDAAVTDLPYGKASKETDAAVEDFLDTVPGLVEGKTVFMSDQDSVGGHEPEFEVYVHRNLTRYIYII